MPSLAQTVVDDIEARLRKHLLGRDGYGEPKFLNAGGSAAVFRVESAEGIRAVKGYDPSLFRGSGASAERRRMELQQRLIGHSCSTLVQTHSVHENEGTAFIEMEFVPWPQLTEVLKQVPDVAVPQLIMQLVDTVKFLDAHDIVHRDIKPENIHVSKDFSRLKLLDLGVAREYELDTALGGTDQGNQRPFLATAQYSSPEYLFRLDEPSPKLWRALNIYQVGAVLHDLVMKVPLFQQEVEMANRWLLARAVLTKIPSFADADPGRLASLKALASRCLVKDMNMRLQLVGWEDFLLEGAQEPIAALKGRLAKGRINAGNLAKTTADARLAFDRSEFVRRLQDKVRSELIETCGNQLPLTVHAPLSGANNIQLSFTVNEYVSIESNIEIGWLTGIYERSANIAIAGWLLVRGGSAMTQHSAGQPVCQATILEGEDESATVVVTEIAAIIGHGLDLVEGGQDLLALHGSILKDGAGK